MKVALIQMQVTAGDVAGNRARGLAMAREAAQKAEVIVLPEIWTVGYALKNIDQWAEDQAGPTITALQQIAVDAQATIITGSLPYRKDGQIYNGAFVINPAGEIVGDYQKVHLFNLMGEQRFFAPGNKRCTFPLQQTTAGLTICYDLRFPELYRATTQDGATIIFVPAEWPASRGSHWRTLLQARAIENQIYICAVNCVGQHRDNVFYGHSMIISPTGDIIAEGTETEAIIYGEIDIDVVEQVRKSMSVWPDRRPELYR
ncbi:carbon-nitrogen family hydrolase [Anaerospora hongkongensis]|uniref:carbon-nitrogen family hydrolase n=1 Tax=Anaerospora hongkongensis TaxID=244830 RepID=UPI002899059B|nr:carbon-nitrogen family hydrolase [Anaerospora hongkongensis]